MIDTILKRNLLPDSAIRFGIRRLLSDRLREEERDSVQALEEHLRSYADDLKTRPIAENTLEANEQHYEVPADFYRFALGPRLKYSSCYFPTGKETLREGELAMLRLYVERADLKDGQRILELGCGWGSLSLYLAELFPRSTIVGVSNSHSQRRFVMERARTNGLSNLQIVTSDMNVFEANESSFDRVVSVEMFEHMKNYGKLLGNIARWLVPGGKLFVHIFTHRRLAYHFVSRGPGDWMARYFFTGGQMPSHHLLRHFQDDLRLTQDWEISGKHYQRTAELWLQNMDRHREEIMPLFRSTYGKDHALKWWSYWRVFFMSCAELWGFDQGKEWIVSHYLFETPK